MLPNLRRPTEAGGACHGEGAVVTVYLVLGVVGLLLLAVSLVLGDLLDGAFDVLAADWFSSAVLGGAVSAFGFGAAVADASGLPVVPTVLVGLVAGAVMGWFASWLTRLVKGGGSEAPAGVADTVGLDATVLTAVPADGYGVVRVVVGGNPMQLNARTDTGETVIPVGTPVHVTGVVSPTAVTVAPVWPLTS